MNPNSRPGITTLSRTNRMTSRYTFPILEASPFVLAAISLTIWEALLPGPDQIEHLVDYCWNIPTIITIQLALSYLILHGLLQFRFHWYPITPLTQAYLDLVRTYCCCYAVGLWGVSSGVRLIFVMASYMDPYDAMSRIPTANSTFRVVCVFFGMAYVVLGLGVGILVGKVLLGDRRRMKDVEGGVEWREVEW